MSDFETDAELSLTVPPRELRNVRQQIESGIGTVEVGMTDGGSMSAQAARGTGAGSGSRERRWRRREHRWARDRTEYLDDAVTYLKDIEDKVGGDGATGGIFGTLLDLGGEAGGAVGGAVGTGGAAAIGSAVGSAIGNVLAGATVEIEKPQWVPIGVREPEWDIAVSRPEWTPLSVDRPEWLPLAIEEPPTVGFEDPPAAPVETVDPLPVQRDPLPVNTTGLNISSSTTTSVQVGGMARRPRESENTLLPDFLTGSDPIDAVRGPLGGIGDSFARAERDAVRWIHDIAPGTSAEDVEPLDANEGRERHRRRRQPDSGSRSPAPVQVTTTHENDIRVGDIVVDAEVNQDLDGEMRRLEQDILDEVDDRIEDALSEFERDITRGRR